MTFDQHDKPRPGETLDEYLWRHHAHPDDPNARQATEEEMAAFDRTEEFLDGGFLIVPQPHQSASPPSRPSRSELDEDASPTQEP